jgi:hypothetical protein
VICSSCLRGGRAELVSLHMHCGRGRESCKELSPKADIEAGLGIGSSARRGK